MAKQKKTERDANRDIDKEQSTRDAKTDSAEPTFSPKLGEDPGLLPMNEDPRERRLKRNTM